MEHHYKFRGRYLTAFDGAQHNRFDRRLSKKADEFLSGAEYSLYINEENGQIFLFIKNVDEQNFVCTFDSFEELNEELENWQALEANDDFSL